MFCPIFLIGIGVAWRLLREHQRCLHLENCRILKQAGGLPPPLHCQSKQDCISLLVSPKEKLDLSRVYFGFPAFNTVSLTIALPHRGVLFKVVSEEWQKRSSQPIRRKYYSNCSTEYCVRDECLVNPADGLVNADLQLYPLSNLPTIRSPWSRPPLILSTPTPAKADSTQLNTVWITTWCHSLTRNDTNVQRFFAQNKEKEDLRSSLESPRNWSDFHKGKLQHKIAAKHST